MLNGAPTFMTLVGPAARPARRSAARAAAGVEDVGDRHAGRAATGRRTTTAPPTTTRSSTRPIVAGNPAVHRFTVDGKPHLLVDVGEGGVFDGARAARDLERIVQADKALWGSLPYDKYVFFNLLVSASGGLEHKNSVMMMASRWATARASSTCAWLSLASHEYFHLWNVKRLRPMELGPVRLRARGLSAQPVDFGRADRLLRRPPARARRAVHAGRIPGASSPTPIRTLQTTPGAADADRRDGLVRRLDQAVPAGRQHA